MSDMMNGGGVEFVVDINDARFYAKLSSADAAMRNLASGGSRAFQNVQRDVLRLAGTLDGDLARRLREANALLDQMGRQGEQAGRRVSTGLGILGGGYLMSKFVSGVQDVIRTTADFDTQMRLTWTNMPNLTEQGFAKMEGQVNQFASRMRVKGSDVAKALYSYTSVVTSDDPQALVQKALGKGGVLETAQNAALAGNSDLETTVKALTNVANSYGFAADNAYKMKDASDALFVAVRDGDVRFADLAGMLSNVTPVAAAANVSIADVGANIAVLTKSGDPAGKAVDHLRMLLDELANTGTRAGQAFVDASGGKSFGNYMKEEGNNVGTAMELMLKAAGGNTREVANMFSRVQGKLAALILTSEQGRRFYNTAMYDMQRRSGATEDAATKMRAGLAYDLAESSQAWDQFKRDTGAAAGPLIKDLSKASASLAKALNNDVIRNGSEIAIGMGAAGFAIMKVEKAYKSMASAATLARLASLSATQAAAMAGGAEATRGMALRGLAAGGYGLVRTAGTGVAILGALQAAKTAATSWKGSARDERQDLIYGRSLELGKGTTDAARGSVKQKLDSAYEQTLHKAAFGAFDSVTGYTDHMNLAQEARARQDNLLGKASQKKDIAVGQYLQDKARTQKLSDFEEGQLGSLVAKYKQLAQEGKEGAAAALERLDAITTEVEKSQQLGDTWRSNFNLFDKAVQTTTGTTEQIAAATKDLSKAKADLAERQREYNALLRTGKANAEQVRDAEKRVADARAQIGERTKAVATAKKSTALSLETLTKNNADTTAYRRQEAESIDALKRAGLGQAALKDLVAQEEGGARGTLKAAAARIGSSYFKTFSDTLNKNSKYLADVSAGLVGNALTDMTLAAAPAAKNAMGKVGKKSGEAFGKGVVEGAKPYLDMLVPTVTSTPGGAPTQPVAPAGDIVSLLTGGFPRSSSTNTTIGTLNVNGVPDPLGQVATGKRLQNLGRTAQ